MNTFYRIREGYRLPAALDIEAAGQRLAELQREGRADPASILEDARPVDSPLHPGIRSWNLDPVAAKERILMNEATDLREAIEIVYVVDDVEYAAPAFVHIEATNQILATADAVRIEDQRTLLIQQGLRDLRSWKRRYGQLQEFAKISEHIDSVAA